jgi:Fasciclin domain
MPVTNRKNPIFKIASAAVVLGSSLLVSLPLGAQFLYPSPIFDASYNDFWSSRGCDPDIMKTIACTLQMAIDDGLDYRNFAQVVQASGLMEDLSKDSGEIKFTVLIPKNSTLSAATWENLLKSENKDELKHFVKSHIIRGQITEENVREGEVRTWAGNSIRIQNPSATGVTLVGENGASDTVSTGDASNPGNGIVIFLEIAMVQPNL